MFQPYLLFIIMQHVDLSRVLLLYRIEVLDVILNRPNNIVLKVVLFFTYAHLVPTRLLTQRLLRNLKLCARVPKLLTVCSIFYIQNVYFFPIRKYESWLWSDMDERNIDFSHSSRSLRVPKDASRRISLMNSEAKEKDPLTSGSGNSERDLHWKRILGYPPHASGASFPSSPSLPMLPRTSESKRSAPAPIRSSQTRNTHSASLSRGAHLHTELEFEQPSRLSRAQPPKPFACELCFRKFERRGHLKVGLLFSSHVHHDWKLFMAVFDLLNSTECSEYSHCCIVWFV